MNNSPSSYQMAALPSFIQHADGVLEAHSDYMTPESINKFLHSNVNKFLSSYGIVFERGKPVTGRINQSYQKVFNKFRSKEYLKDIELTIDSGGFQIQVGYIRKDDTSKLISLYHEFLEKNYNEFNYAFVLDLAPGATSSIYDSWEEMENYNYESYSRSAELPKEARDKICYIHHFRTPRINKSWNKMLFEDGMADPFKNFATGGLVSFAGGAQRCPVILYTIPLVSILLYAKKRGLKRFRFHVLGGSEWKDIVFHKLAEYHIKKVHDIDIEITYDSSSIFKLLALGRYIFVSDKKGKLWKMSIRSDSLHMMHGRDSSNEEIFYRCLNEATVPYGMRKLEPEIDPIYVDGDIKDIDKFAEEKTGRMTRLSYMYGIFHMLKLFRDTDHYSKLIAEKIYPIYESGDINSFDKVIYRIMQNLNSGRKSRRLDNRCGSIYRSLKEIEELDLDRMNWYVNQFMSGDECRKFSKEDQELDSF